MSQRLREVVLPNTMTVSCLQRRGVRMIYRQVQAYFKHGIELTEGDIVFDVGANIGLFTLLAYDRAKRDVTVYAFEPIPALFEALQQNARRYDAERLKVFPYGLSKEAGTVIFAYYPRSSVLSTAYGASLKDEIMAALLERRDQVPWLRWIAPRRLCVWLLDRLSTRVLQVEPVVCKMATLSSILRQHSVRRIDLLKVDVEKSELDVLAGIDDADWPKIKQVVVEVHDIHRRVAQVTTLLRERGFSAITVDPSVPIMHIFNIYARRQTPPAQPPATSI